VFVFCFGHVFVFCFAHVFVFCFAHVFVFILFYIVFIESLPASRGTPAVLIGKVQ
jgi:hypothetical protein